MAVYRRRWRFGVEPQAGLRHRNKLVDVTVPAQAALAAAHDELHRRDHTGT
jgi:hypothetical protein